MRQLRSLFFPTTSTYSQLNSSQLLGALLLISPCPTSLFFVPFGRPTGYKVWYCSRHSSLFSFRFPQCGSFRVESNVRSTFRFKALTTSMRANIVGPPDVATRISASIAACHSWASCSALKLRDVVAGVLERDELAAARQRYRIVEHAQPASAASHRIFWALNSTTNSGGVRILVRGPGKAPRNIAGGSPATTSRNCRRPSTMPRSGRRQWRP